MSMKLSRKNTHEISVVQDLETNWNKGVQHVTRKEDGWERQFYENLRFFLKKYYLLLVVTLYGNVVPNKKFQVPNEKESSSP